VPLLYALVLWWVSTAIIILLYRLPQRTYRLSFAALTAVGLASLYGVWLARDDTGILGAYLGFTCGTLLWGWQLAGFYMGFVTGPRQEPLVWHPSSFVRFGQAVHASLHHELAALAGAVVVAALSWNAANQMGWWTYLLLWLMHLAAKINIFLGARNFHAGLLPDHLRHLGIFFRYRPMNLFFPLSVTAAVVVATLLARWALHPDATDFEAVVGTLLSFLTLLGLLEIWLLMTPPAGAMVGRTPGGRRVGVLPVMNQWYIGHTQQSGLGSANAGNRIDGDSSGRTISMDAAGDRHTQRRIAIDLNSILRIGRANVHLQFKGDDFALTNVAARDLTHAGDLPDGDGNVFGGDCAFGKDRHNRVVASVELPSERCCDHVKRLRQSNVAHRAFVHTLREFVGCQPGANLALQRSASLRCINDAQHTNGAHPGAHRRQHNRQRIHCITRVDPCTEQGDASSACRSIQIRCYLWLGAPRVGEFLACRNDIGAGGDTFLQLRYNGGKRRKRGMQHNIGARVSQCRCGIGADGNARRANAQQFAQITTGFLRIDVNGADDLDARPRAGETCNAQTDWAESVTNDSCRHTFLPYASIRVML